MFCSLRGLFLQKTDSMMRFPLLCLIALFVGICSLRAEERFLKEDDVIAFVGMTGLATGPHLHYEYRVNGVFQNPQTVKLPEALPIEGPLKADFLAKSAPLLASLDAPPGPTLVSR